MLSRPAAGLPRAVAAAALFLAVFLFRSAPALCQTYPTAQLPPPDLVVVRDFSTSADQVKLNSGLGSRLTSALESDSAISRKRAATAAKVVNAVADTLVQQIRSLGLAAGRAGPDIALSPYQKIAIIDGEILDIDEGNRTRRTLIGFGAGASRVEADAQLSYQAPGSPLQLLLGYDESGKSRSTPGMAATMGVGGLADRTATSAIAGGGLHAYSETHGSTVEADGARMAKNLAKQLAQYFAAQGWISPGTMPKD
ncbi:MAG TPA: DUF4410 domain-containing protein [Candidatus Udaeobacter sp.]|nr:DUF4410 domain-containing protein [Candidatus Udaeobacter sp.]